MVQGGFGNLGDMARHRVSHLCPAQLAPVTCSISNSPGDHRAGNKPDIHHYYHNDDGGSYRDDDSAMTMSDCRFKTTITESKMPGFFTSNRKLEWAWQWYAMMGNSATHQKEEERFPDVARPRISRPLLLILLLLLLFLSQHLDVHVHLGK